MNDQRLDYVDYESLIRQARMERSIALGNALANGVGHLTSGVSRAFAIIAHAISSAWIGHASDPVSTRR